MENYNNKKMTTKGDATMKGKYLSPKADLTFKLVFGEHKDLAMSLLNALLPLAEDSPIVSLEYETPEIVPEYKNKKNSIVNVRCKDARGRSFIVEMQMQWSDEFKKRVVMNASKAVIKEVGTGEDYSLIQPVFSLNLVDDNIKGEAPDEFYHDYAILNVAHPERSIDYLRFVFVELPKFQPRNIMEKKMAVLWLRFLTEINENTDEVPTELLENDETRKALSIIEKSAMSEGQLYAYEKFWDAVVTERVLIKGGYDRGVSEGEAIGIAKGEAIGIAKGEAIGIAKGEAIGIAKGEAKANRKSALNLKSLGVDIETISKATGLTAEEIEGL